MTCIGIDEIINKLSSKFNKIFCDREFVGSVCEDFQTIVENDNKCCVLVFPVLSPNYLRVVRYQAKLFDLACIALGSGSARSVGVCHKKYFLPTGPEPEENSKISEESCTKQMAENAAASTRKKRPPIQLYVPPAQRRSRLNERSTTQKENQESHKVKSRFHKEKCKTNSTNVDGRDIQNSEIKKEENRLTEANGRTGKDAPSGEVKKQSLLLSANSLEEETGELPNENKTNYLCLCTEDINYLVPNKHFTCPFFSYPCNCVKFLLFKDVFPYAKLLVFSIKRMKHSFHCIRWKQESQSVLIEDDDYLEKWSILHRQRHLFRNVREETVGLFGPNILDFRERKPISMEFSQFQNTYYICGDSIFFHLPKNNYYGYLSVPQHEVFDDELKPQHYIHGCLYIENGSLHLEEFIKAIANSIVLPPLSKYEDLDLDSLLDLPSRTGSPPQMPCEEVNCDNKTINICAKPELTNELTSSTPEEEPLRKQVDRVIVLEDRSQTPPKTGSKSPPRIKNKDKGKHSEHEQEKEIMRKTKQNINRKTRPIIKYVDDDNDTLKIGKGDNINNWEELFNENGELQDDVFSEIIQKVGPEVTVVKATEDYSAYATKQVEELEHMVELYDFPANFETHDIISAFSLLNSDSMYVKWVDDTRALLVLGSSLQAQKAIELSNSLIKARPMSAASSLALEKAYQSDLKPAMKRPQTNLQTARRLITSHLGAKSKVSKEQSAKEREDLRIAKEMKKQAKQNEKDAWEGNIRSTIN